jgi:hypothetical protein
LAETPIAPPLAPLVRSSLPLIEHLPSDPQTICPSRPTWLMTRLSKPSLNKFPPAKVNIYLLLLTHYKIGVIGTQNLSPGAQTKITDLANLLGSEDDFKFAFATKHAEVKKGSISKKYKQNDQIETLLQ